MKREEWYVSERDERPAGQPGECFYCQQPLGKPHAANCGTRQRTVVVRTVIDYVTTVDEDAAPDYIDFERNHSDICADVIMEELIRVMRRSGVCMCHRAHTYYLREATLEDEERDNMHIDDDLPGTPCSTHDDDEEDDDERGTMTLVPIHEPTDEPPETRDFEEATFMPPGEYYIGDLCYVLGEEFDALLRQRDGEQATLLDGRPAVYFFTGSGDGVFKDQHGNEYYVDSGTIGAIRMADIIRRKGCNDELGNIWEFPDGFYARDHEGGLMEFGPVVIDTSWPEGWDPREIKRRRDEELAAEQEDEA